MAISDYIRRLSGEYYEHQRALDELKPKIDRVQSIADNIKQTKDGPERTLNRSFEEMIAIGDPVFLKLSSKYPSFIARPLSDKMKNRTMTENEYNSVLKDNDFVAQYALRHYHSIMMDTNSNEFGKMMAIMDYNGVKEWMDRGLVKRLLEKI